MRAEEKKKKRKRRFQFTNESFQPNAVGVLWPRWVDPTSLGLVLFVFVDEEETGTLGAERQQDALDDRRDEGEAQKQRPQLGVPHDRL